MPVYEYEGKHFDLPEGLSKEQAIAKIEAHLGKAQAAEEAPEQDPTQRALRMVNRGVIKGLSYPVNAVADGLAGAFNVGANLVGSDVRAPYLSKMQDEALDKMAYDGQQFYPKAETTGEKVVQGTAEALSGAMTLPGMGPDTVAKAGAVAGGAAVSPVAYEATKEWTGSDLAATGASLLVSMAGGMAGGKLGAKFDPATGIKPTTIADVEARAKAAYDVIDNSGVRIKPRSAQSLVSRIEGELKANHNYDPAVTPRVATVLTAMRKSIGTQKVAFNQLEQLRGLANNLKTDPDPGIRRLGTMMIKEFDEGVSNIQGSDLMPGTNPKDFKTVLDAVQSARQDWRIRSKASLLQSVLDDVEITGNRPTASEGELIRNQFITIAKNKSKMAMFSKEEQAAIKDIIKDTKTEKVLAQAARFSPQRTILGGVGGVSAPTFLAGTGNYGAAAAAAATSAGALAADKSLGAIRKGKVDSVIQQVLTGQKVSKEDLDSIRGLFGGAVNLQDR
jgi:hypothetical protein